MATISLKSPPDDLNGFPSKTIARNRNLWRLSKRGYGPWWFSNVGGRYDLPKPRGTCYLATDATGALLEVIGREHIVAVIPSTLLSTRVLWRLKPPSTLRLADTTSRLAAGFGVTAELWTVVPYDLPQAWAAAFAVLGVDGVYSPMRHDPAGSQGVAIFGRAGERAHWPKGDVQGIAASLISHWETELGITVIDVPSSAGVRVIDR